MICKGCGCDISSIQSFCPNCGEKLDLQNHQDSQNQQLRDQAENQLNHQGTLDQMGNQVNHQGTYDQVGNQTNHQGTFGQMGNQATQQGTYDQMGNQINHQGTLGQKGNQINHQGTLGQMGNQATQQGTYDQMGNQISHQGTLGQMGNQTNHQGTLGQMGNYIPPMPSPNTYASPQRKNNNLIPLFVILGVLGVVFLAVVIVGFAFFVGFVNKTKNTNEITDTYKNDTMIDSILEDSTDSASEDEDNSGHSNEDDLSDSIIGDNSEDGTADSDNKPKYNITYSYTEIPDVISIDSDSRFTYYDRTLKEEVMTYTYTFDMNLSKKDFYNAVDDYCSLLMNMNDFYYEETFSIDQYNESGLLTEYFSRDNIAIGVTASVERVGWFVYIDIYDLSSESSPEEEGDSEILYNNYSYYLEGRESINYDLATEVQMENGIAFYLNEAVVLDLGDGTSQIDCKMYLGATYDDTYLYTDSFIVLPMDRDGYIIGDASVTNLIADDMGQYQYVPYLLSKNYLYTYTLSFIVPSETTSFTVYGTNLIDGFAAGPVYGIHMVVEE